jgi:hypothetical protein
MPVPNRVQEITGKQVFVNNRRVSMCGSAKMISGRCAQQVNHMHTVDALNRKNP